MLCKNIKEARLKKGFTQVEVAEYLGISYQAYHAMENGIRVPTVERLQQIAEKLGTTMDELAKEGD